MAVNAKKMFNKADNLVAVTGLTKSGGSETEDKPVGTIYRFYFSGISLTD
ncbi:hypothetical protein EG242_12435 [Paenimyroides viscosum]|uniref:Uncharacterized protein n=2 Tax=Paenimyroides viscosum TaxID=2488729 RepID=A0A3P1ARS2_9FLAO|nr:hypothetical protein EG242_12435 [Paenimyroides viscosum]